MLKLCHGRKLYAPRPPSLLTIQSHLNGSSDSSGCVFPAGLSTDTFPQVFNLCLGESLLEWWGVWKVNTSSTLFDINVKQQHLWCSYILHWTTVFIFQRTESRLSTLYSPRENLVHI